MAKQCPRCWEKLEPGTEVCPHCGFELVRREKPAEPSAEAAQEQPKRRVVFPTARKKSDTGFTYKLVFALPFGGSLRAPVKFVHLLEFCVAALAGFGFEAAWRGFRRDGEIARFGLKCVLVVLAVANVVNLACIDSKYCAVEDVSFVRLPNAAAEDVLAAGGGKVFVAIEQREGGKAIRDSLGAHLAEVSDNPSAPDIRYFLVNGTTLRKDRSFNEWVRSGRLKSAGMYAVSATGGITRATGTSAQLALFERPSVSAPPPKEAPVPNRGRQVQIAISVLSTIGLIVWGVWGARVVKVKAKRSE